MSLIKFKNGYIDNIDDVNIKRNEILIAFDSDSANLYVGNSKNEKILLKESQIDVSKLTFVYNTNYTYTSNNITPISIKYKDELLVVNSDYTIEYKNNINVGQASATITGLNQYSGTIIKYFNIVQKNISDNDIFIEIIEINDIIYDADDDWGPSPTIKYNNKTLSGNVDYILHWDYEDGYGVEAGNHWVKVTGINNFTGSKYVYYYIDSNDINCDVFGIHLSQYTYTYDGAYKHPSVTIRGYDNCLVSSNNYNVSYKDNLNAGIAEVIIAGQNSLYGSIDLDFTIEKSNQSTPTSVTASISGTTATVTINGSGTGTKYYSKNNSTWQTSNQFTGLSRGTYYTFYGKYAESDNYYESGVKSSSSYYISKLSQSAPTSISISYSSTESSSITATITASGGTNAGTKQYRINSGSWQTSNTFTVTRGTSYTYEVRYNSTSSYNASSSKSKTETVPKLNQSAPTSINTSVSQVNKSVFLSVSGSGKTTLEYSKDGNTWQSSPNFTNLTGGSNHTFYVRYCSNGIYEASNSISKTEHIYRFTDLVEIIYDDGYGKSLGGDYQVWYEYYKLQVYYGWDDANTPPSYWGTYRYETYTSSSGLEIEEEYISYDDGRTWENVENCFVFYITFDGSRSGGYELSHPGSEYKSSGDIIYTNKGPKSGGTSFNYSYD